MSKNRITVEEIPEYLGKKCPQCDQGTMEIALEHDAMSGNSTVLKCNKRNPCRHTIEIVE